ncbi:MAG: SAM-dependent methyltransferase [Pseudomonadota bacterium]
MTDMPPPLFDPVSLAHHRRRATEDGLFLHDLAIDLVQERLAEVNRTFTKPLIVSWQAERWARGLGVAAEYSPATETLNLASHHQYDLVIHGLELHWANDPVGQLIQVRRSMAPDGLMIAVLFAGETLRELRTALTEAEVEVSNGLSARLSPLGDVRDLGAVLHRAGYALPVADTFIQTVSYKNALSLFRDLRSMGETNALHGRPKTFSRRTVLQETANRLEAKGPFEVTFELAFLTGWVPDASQPKPMRPGSASHRLSDALSVSSDKTST